MHQWEYRKIVLGDVPRKAIDIDVLNELGRDGWELVCIVENGVAYLKREISPRNPDGESRDRRVDRGHGNPAR
jgi:hypothetical protein